MIDLTPLEVRKKKGDFRRQLRGYDPAQVDDFLDLVADRLEAVVRENLSFTERVTRLEQQVADYRDRERALTEALVTAQEMREEIRTQTTREVEIAKRQAVQDADRIRAEAVQERDREEDNLRRLRQRQRQLLHSFRTFLEREISELVVFSTALDMADEAAPDDLPPARPRRGGAGGTSSKRNPESAPEPEAEPAGPSAFGAATIGAGAAAGAPESRTPEPSAAFAPPVEETASFAFAPPVVAEPPVIEPPPAAHSTPASRPPLASPEPEITAPEPERSARPEPELQATSPAAGGAELDPFGDLLSDPSAVARLDDLTGVDDRPESVADVADASIDAGPRSDALGPMTEDDMGELFSSWEDELIAASPPPAGPSVAEPLSDDGSADEAAEQLDELMLSEAELFLSDADVLEEPAAAADDDIAALESVEGGDIDGWLLDDELLFEEQRSAADEESAPGDQPVDLSMLPDDDLASLNLDDLGLPPLHTVPSDRDDFGPSGLTLRPLPSEEDAPDVPRERRDADDDDMFSTLFGKRR